MLFLHQQAQSFESKWAQQQVDKKIDDLECQKVYLINLIVLYSMFILLISHLKYNNMQNFKIEKHSEVSRPLLINITKINSSLPTHSYAIYYKNYTQQDEQIYKSIKNLKEILIPHNELYLKIINFQKQNDPVLIKSEPFIIKDRSVTIKCAFLQYTIVLSGTLINKSDSQNGLVDLHIVQKKGYEQFYKYRKKYKALESLTKKLEFKIDHRIKIKILGKQYQFDLQDKRKEHYYLNLSSFAEEIQIVLEETTSIEDYVDTKQIEEVNIDMKQLLAQQFSYVCTVSFMNQFSLKFLFNIVKNDNFSTHEFVSIRVLETQKASKMVRIGTQHTINLTNGLKLQPLISNRFYDYEWGYLSENLSKIQGNHDIYDFLDKISPSVPKYTNFINQEIIDLSNSNFLIFDMDGIIIKIPIIYVLKGFNYIENNKGSIKFYIDSSGSNQQEKVIQINEDKKRIYELSLQQFLNLNKINKYLQKFNTSEFTFKIINDSLVYFIPFSRKLVSNSQFRKQVKQLQIKKQICIRKENQYYSLQNHSSEKAILIQTVSNLPFYIIELNSSSSLSFQIAIQNHIVYEGSFSKRKIINSEGKSSIHLLSQIEGGIKIGLVLKFVEIDQPYESASTYYHFKHRLYFPETAETDETTYDLQIEFLKGKEGKKLKSKLSPQVKRQSPDIFFLRDFPGDSGILSKEETLTFRLKIKKMFYNVDLNYFDNQILQQKVIAINPDAQTLKAGSSMMFRLQSQHYRGIQIDLYDSNIKKRMKYYIQVFAKKNQFLDYKDSSYRVKIPYMLWNFNNQYRKQQSEVSYEISTHLSRRDNNIDTVKFSSNHLQEIKLNHYQYNDGLSLSKHRSQITYAKFINAIKIKCDVNKDKIGWSANGQWFFTVLALENENFYFLMNRQFDPYEQKDNADSDGSRKTVSRSKSNRSDMHKIDPLAKTINNLDLFNLKKKKNDLVAETRQLTARYVKRQQKIIELNNKLGDMQQSLKKKEEEQKEIKTQGKKNKKENVKMRQFYRSICQCGDPYPKFNGYCQNCLKLLKKKYEIYHKEYKEKCYKYDKMVFEKFNKQEKIENLKKKISKIQNQEIVVESQDGGAELFIKNMQQKNLKSLIQDLKLSIFELQEERGSLVQRSNYQMSMLEQKIAKEDDRIYKNSQDYDSLKNKLSQIMRLVKQEPAKTN